MLFVALTLAAVGVVRGRGSAPPDTLSLCAVATTQAIDVEWASRVAPRSGTLADIIFSSHATGTAVGAETARAAVRAQGSGTVLCYVDVPCVISAGTTVTGTCPVPEFATGAVLSAVWESSGCLTRPSGHLGVNLVMP